MKRKKVRLFCLLVMTIFIVGTMAATVPAETTITLWTPAWEMDRKADNPWTWVYSEFERENPGVNIEVTFYSIPLLEKLLPAFAANAEPDLSLLMYQSEMQPFVARGLAEPLPKALQEELTEKAVKAVVDFYTWEGQIYGYPYWYNVYVLNWNKDMFREAGLDPNQAPETWEEFREYAKRLTKRSEAGEISRVGYAIRYLGQPLGVLDKMACFWLQKGVYPIDPPDKLYGGKPGFNNEAGVEVFDLYQKMLNEDKSTAFGFPDPRLALLQNKAAMQVSEASAIAYRAPREAPDLDWGMALPPTPKDGKKATYISGWGLMLSSRSQNKDLAFRFFDYLTRPETQQFLHLTNYNGRLGFGQWPMLKETWEHPWFARNSYFTQLRDEVIPYGMAFDPINVKASPAIYAIGQYMIQVWEGKISAEEAVQKAAKKVEEILAE